MGHVVHLDVSPNVFVPTLTTNVLTEQIETQRLHESSALDLGCGTGPIAIALAMCGAKTVTAIDVMPEACELTRQNAQLNGVAGKIEVLEGSLFSPIGSRRFDLIVDDVSGVADEVAALSSWFPSGVPTGGEDGSHHAVAMLQNSRQHLNPGGTLLFPVLSLSSGAKIVQAARRVYGEHLVKVASKHIPFNHELKGQIDKLNALMAAGTIAFDRVRSRYFWTLEIYRATVPVECMAAH